MKNALINKEKFTIEIKDDGLFIKNDEELQFHFSPVEALMLMDILKNEEANLREMADRDSPWPA